MLSIFRTMVKTEFLLCIWSIYLFRFWFIHPHHVFIHFISEIVLQNKLEKKTSWTVCICKIMLIYSTWPTIIHLEKYHTYATVRIVLALARKVNLVMIQQNLDFIASYHRPCIIVSNRIHFFSWDVIKSKKTMNSFWHDFFKTRI